MTNTNDQTTVYLVEDDASVLASMGALLSAHQYNAVPCRSAEAFLKCFKPSPQSALMLDLHLPGMSGLELQTHLSESGIHIPIIVLTAHGDVPIAVQCMRNGAYDFIEKPAEPDRILDSIDKALGVLLKRPAPGPSKQLVVERLSKLTDREREVLEFLLVGKLNKEIADDLGVSRRTVEVHRSRIREKMHARGIADLIRMMGQIENT